MKYRFIDDLTSDVMFEAYGKSMKDLFENAAEALFSVICQTDRVKKTIEKEVSVSAKNPSELMFNWLQELIGIVDTDEIFLSGFKITKITDRGLKAVCTGEEADPKKGRTVVKAVTKYGYAFRKTAKGYVVRASLDI
jgi:SHS2 domain-containing protein